jgi:predicted lactoylglutathione lyase
VADLQRSVDFFTKLGFTFDPQFTDESATCMNISSEAFAMLLVRDRFADFTSKQICDTATSTEVLLALSCESREEVDQLVQSALANGGSAAADAQDHGFMYGWSFQDPDGHTWEVVLMDPAVIEQAEEPVSAQRG